MEITKITMSFKINRANDVNVENLTFGDITVNKYGGKSCRVSLDGSDFYFQTPRMRLPYGLGVYEEKDSDGNVIKEKFSLDFSFAGFELDEDDEPSNPKVHALFSMMEGMQKLLIKKAVENGQDWFAIDDLNESAAKVLTRDILKYARDKVTKKVTDKYPPTFKSKLSHWNGEFKVKAFGPDRQPVDLPTSCTKGSEAVAIIKLTSLTFAGGKCGYSFTVHQIKLYPRAQMPSYAFIDDEDDSTPVVVPMKDDFDEAIPKESSMPTLVPDSDSDEDEEDEDSLDDLDDEEEEVVVEKPKKKSKKVVKKVKGSKKSKK